MRERERIIEYLQGIECEWFPVEWDRFVYDYLGVQGFYGEEALKSVAICYTFLKDKYLINFGSMDGDLDLVAPCSYYFTIDRCKLLLINAVRSVDEPKRKNGGGINGVPSYYEYRAFENLIQINAVYETRISSRRSTAWQNGEFK